MARTGPTLGDWILVAGNEQFTTLETVQSRLSKRTGQNRVWTDDHTNVLDVLDVF